MQYRIKLLSVYLQAYKKGLHYPTHQFLLLGWYRDNWLVESVSDSGGSSRLNCSLEERWHTFQYAMLVRELDFNTDKNVLTEGGLVRNLQTPIFLPVVKLFCIVNILALTVMNALTYSC